jgi:hypothetical protein
MLQCPESGKSRLTLTDVVARLKAPRVSPILIDLLDEPTVAGHVAGALENMHHKQQVGSNMEVEISQIREVTDKLLLHIMNMGIEKIDLSADYYWNIPRESLYDNYEKPDSFSMGQLSEDLYFVQQIHQGIRPPLAYGLVWIASLLRFIGEEVVE